MFAKELIPSINVLLILILLFSACQLSASVYNPAYLGVYVEELGEEERQTLNLTEGVRIEDVVPDSPAAIAGLVSNDIILRINGRAMLNSDMVRRIILDHKPGDSLRINYLSDRKRRTVSVTLTERDDDNRSGLTVSASQTKYLGFRVQTLTEQLKEFFEVVCGVLISEVIKDSPADRVGIKAGDILQKASDTRINSSYDLQKAIEDKSEGDTVTLSVSRKGNELTFNVPIEISEKPFLIDMNGEIIILEKDETFGLSGLRNWFQSVLSDSTKKEFETRLLKLQEEIDNLRKRLRENK